FFSAAAMCNLSAQNSFFRSLASFDGSDGFGPRGVVQGRDGNFYGTTNGGGLNNKGAIFKVTPAGELTMLYSLCAQPNCADGSYPPAGLVQGTDGNFYGTTNSGGSDACYGGCGTIFKITPSGNLTTLHKFCSQANCADGKYPIGGVMQANDGNFYGTTFYGG